MRDYMVRAIGADEQIRAFAVTGKELVETARKAHNTSPIATAALGRTMCGALMMADMLKGDHDFLTLKIDGDGPMKNITVTADNHGNVKGFVTNPAVILPPEENGHLNVPGGIGSGTLSVSRDLEDGQVYSSQVLLHSGEIADDLTYYFAESEQVPSSVGLGVLMNKDNTVREAGGFIIQLMPDTSEEVIQHIEENLKHCGTVTDMLAAGKSPEQMLEAVLQGMDLHITGKEDVQFHCSCSRERVSRALLLLGRKELNGMIEDGEPITLHCHFCEKQYTFSLDELKDLAAQTTAP